MTRMVKQHPVHEPIPAGWRKARQRKSLHQRFSVLIEPVKMTRPGPSEFALHCAVANFLNAVLLPEARLASTESDVAWTTFPAGGGGKARGGKLKRLGLKAGWPDIQLVWRGRFYGIELKQAKGRLSTDQVSTHRKLCHAGAWIVTCRSIEEVGDALRAWGIPTRQRKAT